MSSLVMSRKERLFHGITCAIRNTCKKNIFESFFVSNNLCQRVSSFKFTLGRQKYLHNLVGSWRVTCDACLWSGFPDVRPLTEFLVWLPLQSLAVESNFICANFGRWKTFRKVPVGNFEAAGEGLKHFRNRFGSFFAFFKPFFRIDLRNFQRFFRSGDVPL